MGFRDNLEAELLRTKNELEEEREARRTAEAKLADLKNEKAEEERLEPTWWEAKMIARQERKDAKIKEDGLIRLEESLRPRRPERPRRISMSGEDPLKITVAILFLLAIFVLVVHGTYRYVYDIQSGTVVDRERIPGHMVRAATEHAAGCRRATT